MITKHRTEPVKFSLYSNYPYDNFMNMPADYSEIKKSGRFIKIDLHKEILHISRNEIVQINLSRKVLKHEEPEKWKNWRRKERL